MPQPGILNLPVVREVVGILTTVNGLLWPKQFILFGGSGSGGGALGGFGAQERRRAQGGGGTAPLCLPIISGQIQFYHFIPGWSGIQQAVGCLSPAPESRVSPGSGASGWVLWL